MNFECGNLRQRLAKLTPKRGQLVRLHHRECLSQNQHQPMQVVEMRGAVRQCVLCPHLLKLGSSLVFDLGPGLGAGCCSRIAAGSARFFVVALVTHVGGLGATRFVSLIHNFFLKL